MLHHNTSVYISPLHLFAAWRTGWKGSKQYYGASKETRIEPNKPREKKSVSLKLLSPWHYIVQSYTHNAWTPQHSCPCPLPLVPCCAVAACWWMGVMFTYDIEDRYLLINQCIFIPSLTLSKSAVVIVHKLASYI